MKIVAFKLHSLSIVAAIVALLAGCGRPGTVTDRSQEVRAAATTQAPALHPPASGRIVVAVALSAGAEVVDFAGPWGVFEYAAVPDRDESPFQLCTVAESVNPLKCSGGLVVVPDYSFSNAPQPAVIVVPAMGEPSAALIKWLQAASAATDVTMSVCNGSFVLAQAGLLSGRTVTSHHGAYALLAAQYPDVTVRRGARFVDSGRISSSGGLTSGIDLALHIVERYYGRAVAIQTARDLEYQGQGWMDPDSNVMFAMRPLSTDAHPVCPICEMEVERGEALTGVYNERKVYFCSEYCKGIFEINPVRCLEP